MLTLSISRFDFARGLLVDASQEGIGTTTFSQRDKTVRLTMENKEIDRKAP